MRAPAGHERHSSGPNAALSSDLPDEIRRAVESDGDSIVSDLHVWRVSPGRFSAIVSVVAHNPKPVEAYREVFAEHEELVHVTAEVRQCHAQEPELARC